MNLKEVKYDAFISYRHCELDQFVAETLHKELEAFRLPKSVQKQLEQKGIRKKKIERVFRDRDELPITNNLADPIMNALSNSEYLLVICSPRLSQSMWCKKEIETFISMHGREKVFAVLIEGEPSESFPEELLYEERKIVDANGVETVQRVPIEPLAADVRGKDKKEIRKKIKEEVIRLSAPMFGCGYDDLKQRHRERMMKRIITGACAVSLVFGTFGIVSTGMALRIQKQSEQIKEQSEKINEQYQEALVTNAKQMAEDAFDSMDKGDRQAAIQTAYSALTKVYDADMPYTPEAEYALSTALQTYYNGEQILAQRVLEQDSAVSFCETSWDSQKLAVVDRFSNLSVYDPLTGEVLYETAITGNTVSVDEEDLTFIGNSKIAYPIKGGFCVYDLENEEVQNVESEYFISSLHADREGNYILTAGTDGLDIYDAKSMERLISEKTEYENHYLYTCEFARNLPGFVAIDYETPEGKSGVCVFDINNKTSVRYDTTLESVSDIWFEDGEVFFCGYNDLDAGVGTVYCMDMQANLKWEHVLEGIPKHLVTFGKDTVDKLAYQKYGALVVLNKSDGTILRELNVGTEIVNYAAYTDSNILNFMTREGILYHFTPEMEEAVSYTGEFISTSDNLKEFIFGAGFYASVEHISNSVVVYETAMGTDVELKVASVDSIGGAIITDDGKYIVAKQAFSDILDIFWKEDGSVVATIECADSIRDFGLNKKDELVVLFNERVEVYDISNGELIHKVETEFGNEKLVKNATAYVADNLEATSVIDIESGKCISQIEETDILRSGLLASAVDEDGNYYAFCDEENRKVNIGSFEEEFSMEIPLNVAAIDDLAIASEAKLLFVNYLDDKVEAYDISTGNLVMDYGILKGGVTEVLELKTHNLILLKNIYGAFMLNEELQKVAYVQGFSDYFEKNDSYILSDSRAVCEVKRHELSDLLKEAEAQLGQ